MLFENLNALRLARQRNVNGLSESPGPKQRGVNEVRAVGGGHNEDAAPFVETVQLRQ